MGWLAPADPPPPTGPSPATAAPGSAPRVGGTPPIGPPAGASAGPPAGPPEVEAWPDEPTVSGPPVAGEPVGGRTWIGGSLPSSPPPTPPLHEAPDPLLPGVADNPILAQPAQGGAASRRHLVLTVVASVLLAALAAAAAVVVFDDDTVTVADGGPGTTRGGPNLTLGGDALDIAALLEKAQPSVVTIETNTTSLGGVYGGAGSGVVLTDDGLVLTNAHVIDGAESITVRLHDGSSKRAELVGSFPDEDIALVQLAEASGLTPAELGSSDSLKVGDEVVAIGNALNLGGTPSVTVGIVSALDRAIEAPGVQLDNLIQTDAAINPGNSGGPLVNAAGQVVGINTAIIDDAQNIGFALSIDALKPLIDDLKAGNGEITGDTPRLGVTTITVEDVEEAVLEEFEVQATEGAFVASVLADSAASDAGIEEGDVILEVEGEAITTSEALGEDIRAREVGDEIDILVERGGETQTLSTTLRGR